jgi:ADP-heptose:LPS heptosyltransferase
MSVEAPGDDFDSGPDAFLDVAAGLHNLDLVISCDTAVMHLAGALARPTWLVLKHVADSRWLRHRTDSPWYPTLRLFRQPARGDWRAAFESVVAALQPSRAGSLTPPAA